MEKILTDFGSYFVMKEQKSGEKSSRTKWKASRGAGKLFLLQISPPEGEGVQAQP